ncbi:MAG TPA: hypothetical protein VLA99_05020 [Nitrospiraceae bacterium]|nr:hypothetical protein [Nitrospiraceae bacterium]
MALDAELGGKMLQLITSRYNDWKWRKKIEKTLSLPQSGVGDEAQRAVFLYLKQNLKAYKSRRADPDSWMVGGFATKQVIDRIKATPSVAGPSLTEAHVANLGVDPGGEVNEAWWEDMLAAWFDEPEPEPSEQPGEEGAPAEKAASEDRSKNRPEVRSDSKSPVVK